MREKFENIVIGAGMAGLVCAGHLAKAGQKTLLLEKGASVGGRTASIKMNGYNMCLHLPTIIISENNGVGYGWANAAKEFGVDIRAHVVLPSHYYFRGSTTVLETENCYSTEATVAWMMKYLKTGRPDLVTKDLDKELMLIVDEFLHKPFKEMCEEWDEVSVRDWVEARSKNSSIKWLFSSLQAAALALAGESAWEEGSVGKGFILIRLLIAGQGAMVSLHPDVQDGIVNPIVDAVTTKYGCDIRTNQEVSEVLIEDGRAVGVAIKRDGQPDEIINADKLVIATEWKDYKNLFKTMPASLEETLRIPAAKTAVGILILTGLNDSITLPGNFIFVMDPKTGGKSIGGCPQSVEQPWNFPMGKQFLWSYVKAPNEEFEEKGLEAMTAEHNEFMEGIYPGFKKAIEFQYPHGGIGNFSYEYSSYPKVKQQSPDFEGLYFAGEATAPMYGLFSDGCAAVGLSVAKNILGMEKLAGI